MPRNTIIFPLAAPLLAEVYLPGIYAWAETMRLETAQLVVTPPADGELVLALEVAGAVTNKTFTVRAGALEVRQTLTLGVKVTAGQTVRWRVTSFSGADEAAATRASVTLTANREADTQIATPALVVWWVNGRERFPLFTYADGAFTEVSAGLATGRATITSGASFSIAIEASEALRVAAQTLRTVALVAGDYAVGDAPQLRFYAGGQPIATLTKAGALIVPGAAEQTPVDQTGQFLLGEGAALNAQGVLAEAFAPL